MSSETKPRPSSGPTLKPQYDFIVCGSGSSGSVVARRLAESPDVSVLLIEAGGDDDQPDIMDASAWPALRTSPQNWMFEAIPNPHLNGRSIAMHMGKVLGGGASINVMVWSRGHQDDWDHFAAEAGDDGWNYQSVLQIYRRIEDWHGPQDHARRGTGGPHFMQPTPEPKQHAAALLQAFAANGVPTYQDQNGAMMEGAGGAALTNMCVRNGRRQSVFRSYVHPYLAHPNLTVLTETMVTKVTLDGTTATGVEFVHRDKPHRVTATHEVVLSLGAIHTPKILMLSGIGDSDDLAQFGIPTVQHLPGVGRNLQDHPMTYCAWEAHGPLETHNNLPEVTAIWKSDPALKVPDLQTFSIQRSSTNPLSGGAEAPPNSWSMTVGALRSASRGRLHLTGSHPTDPIEIDANFLDAPDDIRALRAGIEFIRSIGASPLLRPFVKGEFLPATHSEADLLAFIRNGTVSHSHESCTAKMGRDAQSVVDSQLRVYGIDRLRIADASIMPRVTTGNTMAPCVVIGERAADMIRMAYGLS